MFLSISTLHQIHCGVLHYFPSNLSLKYLSLSSFPYLPVYIYYLSSLARPSCLFSFFIIYTSIFCNLKYFPFFLMSLKNITFENSSITTTGNTLLNKMWSLLSNETGPIFHIKGDKVILDFYYTIS